MSTKPTPLMPWVIACCAFAFVACAGSAGHQQRQVATAPSRDPSRETGATPGTQTACVTLAYTQESATRLFIRRHMLDTRAGEEQEVPLPGGCGQVTELALAPGAGSLALVCALEPWPVYMVNVSSLDYVEVAEKWGGGLRWSPDGLTLAYGVRRPIEERAPSDPVAVHLVSSDGSNDREVVPAHLWQGVGPWAPDGESLLITTCVFVEQLGGHILIMEQHWLEGEREPSVSVVAEGVTPVDWSLRANAVLGWHGWCPEGGRATPWVVEMPAGDSYGIAPPDLSPAGWLDSGAKALLYRARSPDTLDGEVWLADRKGSWQLERVLTVPEGINALELAPDRRSILYIDGTGALYVWDVIERGEPRLLAQHVTGPLSAALDHAASPTPGTATPASSSEPTTFAPQPGQRWGAFLFCDEPVPCRLAPDQLTPPPRPLKGDEGHSLVGGHPGYRQFDTIDDLARFINGRAVLRVPQFLPPNAQLIEAETVVGDDGKFLLVNLNHRLVASASRVGDADLVISYNVYTARPLAIGTSGQPGTGLYKERLLKVRGEETIFQPASGPEGRASLNWFEDDGSFWAVQARRLDFATIAAIAESLADY